MPNPITGEELEAMRAEAFGTLEYAKGDEIYLKMINLSNEEEGIEITLDTDVEETACGEILTGDPLAQNSMEEPNRVHAVPLQAKVAKQFTYRAPAHSLTALKLIKR